MIGQQAPPVSLQLASGSQQLSIKAHFKKGSIENHKILRMMMVKKVLKGLENKFSLIHPKTPTLDIGGLISSLFSFFAIITVPL